MAGEELHYVLSLHFLYITNNETSESPVYSENMHQAQDPAQYSALKFYSHTYKVYYVPDPS